VTVAGPTSRCVVPADGVKLEPPEYVPTTVTFPDGEPLDEHEPVPASRVATHSAVEPSVNATVPDGDPVPIWAATVAEKDTA
jgi:hypothetical protein